MPVVLFIVFFSIVKLIFAFININCSLLPHICIHCRLLLFLFRALFVCKSMQAVLINDFFNTLLEKVECRIITDDEKSISAHRFFSGCSSHLILILCDRRYSFFLIIRRTSYIPSAALFLISEIIFRLSSLLAL